MDLISYFCSFARLASMWFGINLYQFVTYLLRKLYNILIHFNSRNFIFTKSTILITINYLVKILFLILMSYQIRDILDLYQEREVIMRLSIIETKTLPKIFLV